MVLEKQGYGPILFAAVAMFGIIDVSWIEMDSIVYNTYFEQDRFTCIHINTTTYYLLFFIMTITTDSSLFRWQWKVIKTHC